MHGWGLVLELVHGRKLELALGRELAPSLDQRKDYVDQRRGSREVRPYERRLVDSGCVVEEMETCFAQPPQQDQIRQQC